jgi:hypothetical protein
VLLHGWVYGFNLVLVGFFNLAVARPANMQHVLRRQVTDSTVLYGAGTSQKLRPLNTSKRLEQLFARWPTKLNVYGTTYNYVIDLHTEPVSPVHCTGHVTSSNSWFPAVNWWLSRHPLNLHWTPNTWTTSWISEHTFLSAADNRQQTANKPTNRCRPSFVQVAYSHTITALDTAIIAMPGQQDHTYPTMHCSRWRKQYQKSVYSCVSRRTDSAAECIVAAIRGRYRVREINFLKRLDACVITLFTEVM